MMLSADVSGGMRQIILAVMLVFAALAAPVGAQEQVEYTPPGDRSIDELADVYNAHLDAEPGWLRGVLRRGAGAQVGVIVFADATMDEDGGNE